MTSNVNPSKSHNSLVQRFLFLQKLGWLGGLGVLSGGIALAQTPKEVMIPDAAQSVDVVPPVEVPGLAQPEVPAFQPAPVAPETLAPELSTPSADIPDFTAPEVPAVQAPVALPSPAGVDTYDEPAAIVFSERSTGCQNTVQFGQGVDNGPCGAPVPPPIAPAIETAATAVTSIAASAPATVQVGPVSISSSGLSLSGVTTPSVRNYYNRTIRPPAQLGNSNIKLIFPLSMPAAISSVFGWRIHPISGDQRFHSGTDLAAPLGTPVLAAYAGQVALADFFGGYGLAVALDHNKGTQQTLYAHLSEIFVKPGMWVKQGEVIGRVGSTGNSTGPHLHFEFRQLTPEGWVALDAGQQLEYALAQLVKALEKTAQAPQLSAKS